MVAKRIIPCLDVADGRVVKGVNFVGLRDAGDPVELACRYSASGADELVFLDIAASHQGRATLVDLVRRTAEAVTIPFTVGGGISSVEGITELLRANEYRADAYIQPLAYFSGAIPGYQAVLERPGEVHRDLTGPPVSPVGVPGRPDSLS